jgi:hypothetical protein
VAEHRGSSHAQTMRKLGILQPPASRKHQRQSQQNPSPVDDIEERKDTGQVLKLKSLKKLGIGVEATVMSGDIGGGQGLKRKRALLSVPMGVGAAESENANVATIDESETNAASAAALEQLYRTYGLGEGAMEPAGNVLGAFLDDNNDPLSLPLAWKANLYGTLGNLNIGARGFFPSFMKQRSAVRRDWHQVITFRLLKKYAIYIC